ATMATAASYSFAGKYNHWRAFQPFALPLGDTYATSPTCHVSAPSPPLPCNRTTHRCPSGTVVVGAAVVVVDGGCVVDGALVVGGAVVVGISVVVVAFVTTFASSPSPESADPTVTAPATIAATKTIAAPIAATGWSRTDRK